MLFFFLNRAKYYTNVYDFFQPNSVYSHVNFFSSTLFLLPDMKVYATIVFSHWHVENNEIYFAIQLVKLESLNARKVSRPFCFLFYFSLRMAQFHSEIITIFIDKIQRYVVNVQRDENFNWLFMDEHSNGMLRSGALEFVGCL